MPSHQSPSVSVARRGARCPGGDPLPTVVWVRGDHDVATRRHLAAMLARAGRRDDADVVVDLSGVTFMDASTIGALVAARGRLRADARSLSVRAPSQRARRLLDVCGLLQLVDGPAASRSALDRHEPAGPMVPVRAAEPRELAHVRPVRSRPPPDQA